MDTNPAMRMRAVLWCGELGTRSSWTQLLLDSRVGGLPVLRRHLLALAHADIRDVSLVVPADLAPEFAARVAECTPVGTNVDVVADEAEAAGGDGGLVLEQRADTLVDPRLLQQLRRMCRTERQAIVCLDDPAANSPRAKSPYTVGVPAADEAKRVDADRARPLVPIGVAVRAPGAGTAIGLDVGRYYWHRFTDPGDVRAATTKVLLSTMKATDGMFARNNRRVSLRISRALLQTPVTPNMVTIATLACGLGAGWLLSRGDYWMTVAGSVLAWFASMLDGVDGELARAKFRFSNFGHWLEMSCDYVFYVALFVGLGAGLSRATGQARWFAMGVAAGLGAILSFAAVAHLKRTYARRGAIGDFYLAYERTVTAPGSSVFMRLTPHLTAFFTRAVFPYFLVLFSLLGLGKIAMVLMFVATQSFWMVALWAPRLRSLAGQRAQAWVQGAYPEPVARSHAVLGPEAESRPER